MKVSREIFSKRVYRVLTDNDLYTLEEIEELGVAGLLRFRGVGRVVINEIGAVLRFCGYELKEPEVILQVKIVDVVCSRGEGLIFRAEEDIKLSTSIRYKEVDSWLIYSTWASDNIW